MRVAVFHAPRRLDIESRDEYGLGSDEVLVSVKATGLCAGDMYIYQGKNPYVEYPQVGGHEISGVVEAIGQDVEKIEVNDRVVVEPFIGCDECYPCRVGKLNCCANLKIIGVHFPGGFGEKVKAPASKIHKIPDDLSFVHSSFAEPLAIGVQASRRAQLETDEKVLIIGCGPIGLALVEVALARGAKVYATDMAQSRLDFAAKLGAIPLPAGDRLTAAAMDHTAHEGFPVVIEATGHPAAMESTMQVVASGGRIVIVGLVKAGAGVTFPGLDFTRKEVTILGSRASVNCFPEAIELLASGSISYPDVASVFPMWDAPLVFDELDKNPAKHHKAVFVT